MKIYLTGQKRETLKVILLWSMYFLYGIGNVISYNCALSIILLRVGLDSLPSLLLISALLVIFVTKAFESVVDRLRPDKVLLFSSLIIIGIAILFIGALQLSDVYDWLYMVFYIFTITAGAF
ncbi:MAG: hypothetical protein HON94_05440, partial [Methylococcales bacterium]|nr:hypothetical protein [Methylococcales bacterium]